MERELLLGFSCVRIPNDCRLENSIQDFQIEVAHLCVHYTVGCSLHCEKTPVTELDTAIGLMKTGGVLYLIYTSTEDVVPLLVPLECKYGSFVLPQGACQIS